MNQFFAGFREHGQGSRRFLYTHPYSPLSIAAHDESRDRAGQCVPLDCSHVPYVYHDVVQGRRHSRLLSALLPKDVQASQLDCIGSLIFEPMLQLISNRQINFPQARVQLGFSLVVMIHAIVTESAVRGVLAAGGPHSHRLPVRTRFQCHAF